MTFAYHSQSAEQALKKQESSMQGLTLEEVKNRIELYGYNTIHVAAAPSRLLIFFKQFKSPLIYILLMAMIISITIEETGDAIFIAAVLLLNALIGMLQEYGAEKTAQSLKKILPQTIRVLRAGESYEIPAQQLVPGDMLILEPGAKMPADCRLIKSYGLAMDESLLTGESYPVQKEADIILEEKTALSDRVNLLFSGTLVNSGQGLALVIATGGQSELGKIAQVQTTMKPPLLIRMETFTRRIAYAMGLVVLFMLAMSFIRGTPILEMLYVAVALAVAAIPEGLPVAITIALAIGMRRMSQRNVIVRKLVSVEALGSCTYIGSDKTGTLTVNELTIKAIVTPNQNQYEVEGQGIKPEGQIQLIQSSLQSSNPDQSLLEKIGMASILTNHASLAKTNGDWSAHGDSVDIAFLVFAEKLGLNPFQLRQPLVEIYDVPYEPEKGFSATFYQQNGTYACYMKGAPEVLIQRSSHILDNGQLKQIDKQVIHRQVKILAKQGYKVLAVCERIQTHPFEGDYYQAVDGLTFLGLVGIVDPLRKEVPGAIERCFEAGLEVDMITGDHPETAFSIARALNLTDNLSQVKTGVDLSEAENQVAFDAMVKGANVFARVSPEQKMEIVNAMKRNGAFVAVTGDGINDVPALKAAHVGVAMGKQGTDVAREASSMIITDDNFASIVAGIEEGRIAYANVRKVIYFTISTGLAEVLLFVYALSMNMPLPLIPVQLLWLNLVTSGIQDVALAFEEKEGDELKKQPKSPKEPIFDRLMIKRVLLASFVMSTLAFMVFYFLVRQGYETAHASNLVLLLMVFFENIQAFNCRSETKTLFKRGILGNRLLFIGVFAAQAVHLSAMYIPGLNSVLNVAPVSMLEWGALLAVASLIFVVVEAQKYLSRRY